MVCHAVGQVFVFAVVLVDGREESHPLQGCHGHIPDGCIDEGHLHQRSLGLAVLALHTTVDREAMLYLVAAAGEMDGREYAITGMTTARLSQSA